MYVNCRSSVILRSTRIALHELWAQFRVQRLPILRTHFTLSLLELAGAPWGIDRYERVFGSVLRSGIRSGHSKPSPSFYTYY